MPDAHPAPGRELEPLPRQVSDSPSITAQSTNRLRASIVDLTFGIWALAVPTALGHRLLNTDGDAARHLRMGEFILSGGLFQPDEFSFTRPGEPFLQTEWLSQTAYALANRALGLTGVAILAGLVIATTYALVVLFLRRRGADPLLAYLTGIAAALIGGAHWLARPHLFTLLALSLLLPLLEPLGKRRLWPFAALFLVWANFHPGYFLGLVVLGAYAAGEWLEARLDPDRRDEWITRARWHAKGAAIGLVASCINPQGPGFLLRITNILGDDFVLGSTNEFMSPNFHLFFGRVFLIMLLGIIVALSIERRPSAPRLALVLFLLAAALHSQRIIPIFGIVALPMVALHFDAAWRNLGGRALTHVRGVFESGEREARPGRWAPLFLGISLLLAATGGRVAGVRLVQDRFDPQVFPVAAVEYARAQGLEGRMFNDFVWGGYLVYAWPEQRIFIDGMTDFFGADLSREYLQVFWQEPGWRDVLEKYDIDFVFVPVEGRIDYALRERPEWTVWYQDRVAVILRRTGVQ